MAKAPHALYTTPANLSRKHRAKTVPPEAHRLVTDIYAHLEKKVLHTAQAKRMPDVHLDRQTDHLGRRIETPERIGLLDHSPLLQPPSPVGNLV